MNNPFDLKTVIDKDRTYSADHWPAQERMRIVSVCATGLVADQVVILAIESRGAGCLLRLHSRSGVDALVAALEMEILDHEMFGQVPTPALHPDNKFACNVLLTKFYYISEKVHLGHDAWVVTSCINYSRDAGEGSPRGQCPVIATRSGDYELRIKLRTRAGFDNFKASLLLARDRAFAADAVVCADLPAIR